MASGSFHIFLTDEPTATRIGHPYFHRTTLVDLRRVRPIKNIVRVIPRPLRAELRRRDTKAVLFLAPSGVAEEHPHIQAFWTGNVPSITSGFGGRGLRCTSPRCASWADLAN